MNAQNPGADDETEEENAMCRKVHGYISSSGTESEPDDSKFELDELFEAFKPPPLNIDPEKHKIIVVDGATPRKMSKSKHRRLRKKRGKLRALNRISNSQGGESSGANQSKPCDNHDKTVHEQKFGDIGTGGDTIKEKERQKPKRKKQKNRDEMGKETEIKQQIIENENPWLHYVDNVGNLINIMKAFVYSDKCIATMYEIDGFVNYNADVANMIYLYYQSDVSRMLERTLHYMQHFILLGIQRNYEFTKKLHYYIELECVSIIQITILYNDFYNEYKAILRQIFLINGNSPNSPSDIALINYLSDVVCLLMKNTLSDRKDPKLATLVVSSDEEFLSLCENLDLVVTSYIETTLRTVMTLAETMKTTLNQKHGLNSVSPARKVKFKTRKISIMDVSAPPADKFKNPGSFIEDFWTRNKNVDNKGTNNKAVQVQSGVYANINTSEFNAKAIENSSSVKSLSEDSSQTQLYQFIIIEDLTENRKYFYDGNYPADPWRAFQTRYLNEGITTDLSERSPEFHAEAMMLSEDLSQTRIYQSIILEDLTENRKYFYDGSYQRCDSVDSWRKFQTRYLNEGITNLSKRSLEFNADAMETADVEISLSVDSSQTQSYQSVIIEDLTDSRNYFYNSRYPRCESADSWRSFESRYLQEDILNVCSESKESECDLTFENNIVNNEFFIPKHIDSRKTYDCNVIQDDLNFDFRGVLKLLILYLLLTQPWFLNLIVSVIIAGADIIVLISLLVYLTVQFVINC